MYCIRNENRRLFLIYVKHNNFMIMLTYKTHFYEKSIFLNKKIRARSGILLHFAVLLNVFRRRQRDFSISFAFSYLRYILIELYEGNPVLHG